MSAHVDVVVAEDAPPQVGGAHGWLYEVYRRWPQPVTWLAGGATNPGASSGIATGPADAAQPRILRELEPLGEIDVADIACLRALGRQFARIRRETRTAARATLHVLRAFPEGIATALLRRLEYRRLRLVLYAHGEEVLVARSSRQLRAAARLAYRTADRVIANSENTARLVLEETPGARVEVVHPGVDCDRAQKALLEIDASGERAPARTGALQLATVARMEPRKNQQSVIRAVADLASAGIDVRYVCAGDGPERARLEQLSRDLGVADRVRFPGLVDDDEKWRILAACDVHVMPAIQVESMIEGFGIVFMEAAAVGKPSVCGRSGGQLEAVVDGATGLAVDGAAVGAVAAAIRRLAEEPGLRERLGVAAMARAAQHDWSDVASRSLSIARAAW